MDIESRLSELELRMQAHLENHEAWEEYLDRRRQAEEQAEAERRDSADRAEGYERVRQWRRDDEVRALEDKLCALERERK